MIKGKKIGSLTMCALVSASALVSGPLAINEVNASDIAIENFKTTYSVDANGKVSIPFGNANIVVKAVGSDTAIADETSGDTNFVFTPTAKQYNVTLSNGDTSKTFVVNINYETVKMSLDETAVCLPSITAKDRGVVLPYPKVLDADDTDITDVNDIEIKVSNKSDSIIVVSDSDKIYKDGVFYKKFMPTTYGTYTIMYTFQKQGYENKSVSYSVDVKPNFSVQGDISFKLDSLIGTPEIDKEFTLPTVTAKDIENDIDDINVITKISYYTLSESFVKSSVKDIKSNKFTPDREGYYVFIYEVSDAFGRTAETATFKTAFVADSKAPTNLTLAQSYGIGEDGKAYVKSGETLTDVEISDVSFAIATKLQKGNNLFVPAVFAKDNLNKNNNELTYTRTLKRVESGITMETIELDSDCTKALNVTLAQEGSYELVYSVKDAKGNESATSRFSVQVLDTFVDTSAPEVTFSNVQSSVKWGEKFTISRPSVIDDNDRIPEVHAYIYYKATPVVGDPLSTEAEKEEIKLNSANKYEIEVLSDISVLEGMLGVASLSDYDISLCFEYIAKDDNENLSTSPKNISIVGDTEVPNIAYTPISGSWEQGEEIPLGELKVTYTNAKFNSYLKDVTVSYQVKNGDSIVGTYGTTYDTNTLPGTLIVSGTKFLASYSGDYDIAIVVTDINGNTAITNIEVTGIVSTSTPSIQLDKTTMEMEVGATESAEIFTMYKDGAVVEKTEANFEIRTLGSSAAVDLNSLKINALSIGETTFTFVFIDGLNEYTEDLLVTVKDTKAPEITFEKDNVYKSAYAKDSEITLVAPILSDNSGVAPTYDVKVTKDGADITVIDNKFTASENGTYSITYTAKDSSLLSSTKTFKFTVGDVEGPSVNVANVPVNKEVGSYFKIDFERDVADVSFDEYETSWKATKNNTTIELKDSEGNVIKSETTGEYNYKLSKAGDYILTITSKDTAGKSSTITKTITVSEKEPEPVEQSSAGLVFAILASLLVLGLVIYYFFKPETSSPKGRKRVNKTDKKDTKKN